jgi:hypothetical protein
MRRSGVFRAWLSNWQEYDGSFLTKARLALKNYSRRLTRFSTCCGNDGEPGC